MAKYTYKFAAKRKKALKSIQAMVLGVVVLLAIALSVSEKLGGPLPTWNSIFTGLGLEPVQSAVLSDSQGAATRIHFIDVGQGDATLIEQDGKFCLIDTGESKNSKQLFTALDNAGVQKISLLVLTHPHSDHIGGARAVIQNYDVEQVLMSDLSLIPDYTTPTLEKLQAVFVQEGVAVSTAKAGDTFAIGKGELEVLYAGINRRDDDSDYNVNDTSIVARFTAPKLTFLSCGDAEKAEERILLDSRIYLRANVLKVSHHGSSTSSLRDFVDAVSPRIAVASCGYDNDYGHPHKRTVETFEYFNIPFYRTDTGGTVMVWVDEAGKLCAGTSTA